MRLVSVIVVAAFAAVPAVAQDVPLPRSRPAPLAGQQGEFPAAPRPAAITSLAPAPELNDLPFGSLALSPSACDLRLREIAEFTPLSGVVGPGECGAAEVVRLDAVTMRDKVRVPLNPPAVLRCPMAEQVAHFVRGEVAEATVELGSPPAAVVNYDSYECRGRNRVIGARISEHGKGNAIDIRAIRLADGRVFELTSPIVPKEFRERVRTAACVRFSTVLGPGSDGYHESHVHFDLAERRGGYKMCQWDVREPPVLVEVPLPMPRPTAAADDVEP